MGMNLLMNVRYMLLSILLVFTSFNVWSETYNYHADVKGMVCAFCAYNVSKNISKLPGVDADSVNVDLKAGRVSFHSDKEVGEEKLSSLFVSSGFTISNLRVNEISRIESSPAQTISIDMNFASDRINHFSGVIEAIGEIAASTPSRLVIRASAKQEDSLLKPLLMGRQQVIKIRFIPTKSGSIHLQLFDTQL